MNQQESPSKGDHARSFILPISVTIIVPFILLYFGWEQDPFFVWPLQYSFFSILISSVFIIIGLILLIGTIRLFHEVGKGTLMPIAPPQNLVVSGIYRYMRNPMITGVLFIVLGESILLSSLYIFALFIFFSIGNHVYFIKSEEPGLVKRFGDDYILYTQNVPRWIPRLRPWDQPASVESNVD